MINLAARLDFKPMKGALVITMVIAMFSRPVWAGGARVTTRAIGGANAGVAPAGVPVRKSANGVYAIPGYRFYPYGYHQGPFYPPVIVTPYAYPYYLPPTVEVNLPFFCVVHQVGFWSRAGMLDHLAGTHKFPLETAAAICPDGAENCLFPSY